MNTLKYLENFIIFSFISLPIFLITGSFLPDLFLSISSILFLILSFKYNLWKNFYNNLIVKIFFLFCALILLRSLYSENIILSLESSLFYFRFGLFSVAIYYLTSKKNEFLKYLFYILIIIYLILFFDSFLQFILGKNISQNIIGFIYENNQNFRITSFFGKDEVLGSYISRLFPFVIYLYFKTDFYKKDKRFFIISIISFLSFLIVLISGERTSIALFIMTLLIFFVSSKFLRKIYLFIIFGVIILTSIITTVDERVKVRLFDQTINQMFNSDNEKIILFSKTYEGHYKIALNMFYEKPVIGHGTKIFRHYCNKPENYVGSNACTTHPHNILMQFLAETGLLGTIFYVLPIFFLIRYLLINIYFLYFKGKQFLNDKFLCLIIFYMINLFPFLPSGNFFGNWLSVIYFLPAGLFLLEIKNINQSINTKLRY
tara:strand:+ start:6137 stop:7429 length:1293 start_codon:yes stop_codon:yes gene_type:complete